MPDVTTPADLSRESRECLRALLVLGAFFFVATAGAYVYSLNFTGPLPRDGSSLVVGRDFLNLWMYGRAAASAEPGLWYDAAAYQRDLAAIVGADYPGQNWSYPPSIMLVAAPFGALGYLPALLSWTLLSLAIFAAAVWRRFNDARIVAALIFSPAAIFCIVSGQSSLVSAAMLLGIFAWLDKKPLVAGGLIGLLTLKPQLGVLLPVMLIASGRWRVFGIAAVTAIAIAVLSAALFGAQAWTDFIVKGIPTQNIVMADAGGIATPYFPTVFMNLRGAGASYGFAMGVQLIFSLVAIAVVGWAFSRRKSADPQWLAALFFACSIAAVPYLLSYDTLALACATLALLAQDKLDNRGRWLARAIYWLPLIQMGLGNIYVPGAALIAPIFALYALKQVKDGPRASSVRMPIPSPTPA